MIDDCAIPPLFLILESSAVPVGRFRPLIGCTCTIATGVDVGRADACLVQTTPMYISVALCFSLGE